MNLLQVLFECKQPTINNEYSSDDIGKVGQSSNKLIEYINKNLNQDQRNAVKMSLEANELFILHGPPGTGKTETITEMVLQHMKRGKKILISSSSNVAVDTIAERLLRNDLIDIPVCRIGHPVRMLK